MAKKSVRSSSARSHGTRTRPYVCDCHLFSKKVRQLSASGFSISDLDLVDYAADAAQLLLDAYPAVVFTSGRRNTQQQADAMAPNVIANRKWIEQTYAKSPERDALQTWVDNNPKATTAAAISAGLYGIMSGWTNDQKGKLSRHFSGQAFDVQPVSGTAGDDIKTAIKGLPRRRKFFENEGGLTIWHADFE